MGDVADILGFSKPTVNDDVQRFLEDKPKHNAKRAIMKPKGMSREVFLLQGWDTMLPATTAAPVLQPGFKDKRQSVVKGKWVWEAFRNSARQDNQTYYHWTKAENVQLSTDSDYPWAKFNTQIEHLQYTDEEYEALLGGTAW